MAAGESEHLLLYDGTCGICHRTVQWVLAADAEGRFRFAPLQGATAADVRRRHPELPTDLDSVIYVERDAGAERAYARSDAVFRITARLGRVPAWMTWAARLPRWLTDLGYRVVARSRHHLSSALGACPLPSDATRARFLP